MPLLWDARALSKRYAPEVGSETVDAFSDALPPISMVTTFYVWKFSISGRNNCLKNATRHGTTQYLAGS